MATLIKYDIKYLQAYDILRFYPRALEMPSVISELIGIARGEETEDRAVMRSRDLPDFSYSRASRALDCWGTMFT